MWSHLKMHLAKVRTALSRQRQRSCSGSHTTLKTHLTSVYHLWGTFKQQTVVFLFYFMSGSTAVSLNSVQISNPLQFSLEPITQMFILYPRLSDSPWSIKQEKISKTISTTRELSCLFHTHYPQCNSPKFALLDRFRCVLLVVPLAASLQQRWGFSYKCLVIKYVSTTAVFEKRKKIWAGDFLRQFVCPLLKHI